MGHAMLLHNEDEMPSSSLYISDNLDAIEYTNALCCCQAVLLFFPTFTQPFTFLMPGFTTLNKRIVIYNPPFITLLFHMQTKTHHFPVNVR